MNGYRVALVTGSSTRGIGLGIVNSLAQQGFITIMHGIESKEEMDCISQGVNAKLGFKDRRVWGTSADVTQSQQVENMVSRVQETFGSLDVLVNNAGIQHVSPVESFPEEQWDAIMGVILKGTFLATKYALPGMRKSGYGRIINTGSMHSLVASPYKSAYNAAKHGVAGFTKTVALETALDDNITCNCVCPGYVMTAMIEKQIANQSISTGIPEERIIEDVLLKDQPIKRFVKSEEVGALVAFLATDAASGITGSILPVDGGWTAR